MTVQNIRDMPSLIEYLSRGKGTKYVYFWGHQKPKNGSIGKECFSQWYGSSFVIDKQTYNTAEHFMMAEKARLFNDLKAEQAILKSGNPGEAKRHGRNVVGFNEEVWVKERFRIVVKANVAKFSQNPALAEFLTSTGKRVLVEASPVDKVWGIGLAADDQNINSPYKWKGLNLLGFALMEVRKRLKEDAK